MTTQRIAIAVVVRGDEVLIGQRPEGVPLAGTWEFPGGKIEAGESAEDAAVRECREETGLAVRVLDAFPTQQHRYEHAAVELHFFRCATLTEDPPQRGFRWVPRASLDPNLFPAANAPIIAWLLAAPPSAPAPAERA